MCSSDLRLRDLHLFDCYNLTGSLSSTICGDVNALLPQLQVLSIVRCENLVEVPKLPASLESLSIWFCPKMVSMPTNLGNVKKLRELSLIGCDALMTLPDGKYGVTALKELQIERCPRIETLPEGLLQQLPALRILDVRDCPKLTAALSRGGPYWYLVEAIPRKIVS